MATGTYKETLSVVYAFVFHRQHFIAQKRWGGGGLSKR